MRGVFLAAVVCLSLPASPAGAQPPGPLQTCWCFAWVHGPDHGTDCFMTPRACDRQRAERGPSGLSRACERVEQPSACERVGWHDGVGMSLGPTRPRGEALLGETLSRLRPRLGPPTGLQAGWHRFGPLLAIRFERGRAARVRVAVPAGLDCGDAARREGFGDPGPALRRAGACEWPGDSPRHRLEPTGRVAGRLDLASATLELWLRSSAPRSP